MTDRTDWNQQIIKEFRENSGKVGGMFANATLLLLHTKGAKTGQPRLSPLAYLQLGPNSYAIFGSKAGMPTNPDWYYNLLAHPDASVEIGTETIPVRARVTQGEERERIWTRQKERMPGFADYEKKTTRQIPVIVLDRAG
jgi:deazaflavin-dependent oxidoreductase (nitroreductase family)